MRGMGRRGLAAALAGTMLLLLTACGGVTEEDVTVYIQGEMDACYLGQYNEDYMALMDYTEEEAAEGYEWNVNAEADRLLYFMDVQYYDDDVMAAAEDLVRQIYAKSRYTVGTTTRLEDGNFTTEVLVEPIELMHLVTEEEIQDIFAQVCADAGYLDYDQINALSEEEYNQLEIAYAYQILALLESLLPEITYGAQQSTMIQMKLDEDNNYVMVGNNWTDMDDLIIDYAGTFLAE